MHFWSNLPFNLIVCLITAIYVIIEGFVAWNVGALTRNSKLKPDIPFIEHGGVWSDLILWPIINGLVWPVIDFHLSIGSMVWNVFVVIGAIFATMCMHDLWYEGSAKTDWLWPIKGATVADRTGRWWWDMRAAGRLHVLFMSAEVFLMVRYLFAPASPELVFTITILLIIHWVLAVVQPGYLERGNWQKAFWNKESTTILATIYCASMAKFMVAAVLAAKTIGK